MKIRAIGTGSKFCRHPLVPACFLVVSGKNLTLIGAPWPVIPALERYGYTLDQLSVITLLSPQNDQIAGLVEIAQSVSKKKKPILAAPAKLIEAIKPKLEDELGCFLNDCFDVKSITKLHIREDYHSEVISFVPNYLDARIPSYGLKFETAKVFISGETQLNEEWIFKQMDCDLILHSCSFRHGRSPAVSELQDLPGYLQNKMWLYGYEAEAKDVEQPFPMLYLPPGSWAFDSDRRDKTLSKERFIRENSKKQF